MSAPVQPIVRHRECAREGCPVRYDPHGRTEAAPQRYCSAACWRLDKLVATAKPRAQLRQSATTRKPRPIAPASPAQRAKRAAGFSIVSGATEGLDAAHLTPRPLGGCADPACVIPLTRSEHRSFDRRELDVLPFLVAHQCVDELAHMLGHYRCDLIAMLERLTGCRVILEERRAA